MPGSIEGNTFDAPYESRTLKRQSQLRYRQMPTSVKVHNMVCVLSSPPLFLRRHIPTSPKGVGACRCGDTDLPYPPWLVWLCYGACDSMRPARTQSSPAMDARMRNLEVRLQFHGQFAAYLLISFVTSIRKVVNESAFRFRNNACQSSETRCSPQL